MATFSHSRLSSYETCPLRYKFAYIDRVKVEAEDTVETFLGSRAHEALEKLYRNLQFERLLSVDEVLAFFNREWEKNWNEAIIIVNKEYTAENYQKMGERYLKDYYKRHKPFDKGPLKGVKIDPEDFRKAVKAYYQLCNWDDQGRPTEGKLLELNIDWVQDYM